LKHVISSLNEFSAPRKIDFRRLPLLQLFLLLPRLSFACLRKPPAYVNRLLTSTVSKQFGVTGGDGRPAAEAGAAEAAADVDAAGVLAAGVEAAGVEAAGVLAAGSAAAAGVEVDGVAAAGAAEAVDGTKTAAAAAGEVAGLEGGEGWNDAGGWTDAGVAETAAATAEEQTFFLTA
jgi:hypothetical protein